MGTLALSLASGLLLTACDRAEDAGPREITEVRQVAVDDAAPNPHPELTTGERFGFREGPMMPPATSADGSPGTQGAVAPGESPAGPPAGAHATGMPLQLTADTPPGWTELQPTQFRNPNYSFDTGNGQAGEVYVTVLSGTGGGLLDNVNRWRNQMGLLPITEIELADLPTIEVLGEPAVFVQLEGSFQGMGGAALENAGLLGALMVHEGQGVFIKLVGPAEAVANQVDNFKSFAGSLRPAQG